MNRFQRWILVLSWLLAGWSLGCNGAAGDSAGERLGEAIEEGRTSKIGAPTITSPVDAAPADGKIHVCVNTASTPDCDHLLSGSTGGVRIPMSGSVSVTAADYVFDAYAIADMRSTGLYPGLKGELRLSLDNAGSGCDVASGTTDIMTVGTAAFWDTVTLSPDQKTLSWDMTGSAAATFDAAGCSQFHGPVHLTMTLPLPLVYTLNGSKIDAPLLISTDTPDTLSSSTTFYQLSPMTLTNDHLDEGATNSCGSPQVVSVQPGWSVNVSGKTAVGTSDFYTFRFDNAYGIPSWFMPSLTLTNTAGGQYVMQVKAPGCGGYAQGGVNCNGNLTAWSQSFPENPSGCNYTYGIYTCTDASPRVTEVVVEVIRLSGTATDQYYTLNAANCNGACTSVFAASNNGFPSGDGYSNTCSGAGTYDVVPGSSFDFSGHISQVGGSDYFVANFQSVPGVAHYYHPKIDLVADAGGQYRILVYGAGCNSYAQGGANCDGYLQTWEQLFPEDPNGCNWDHGIYTCTDASPRISQVVVKVVRVDGSSTAFANYTVRVSNQ